MIDSTEPQAQAHPQPQPQPSSPTEGQSQRAPESAVPSASPATVTALATAAKTTKAPQARNPLHGLTLERIVTELQAHYGWAGLAELIPMRCFVLDPTVPSTLKLLRKTPWAREKVESLYLFMLREQRRGG